MTDSNSAPLPAPVMAKWLQAGGLVVATLGVAYAAVGFYFHIVLDQPMMTRDGIGPDWLKWIAIIAGVIPVSIGIGFFLYGRKLQRASVAQERPSVSLLRQKAQDLGK